MAMIVLKMKYNTPYHFLYVICKFANQPVPLLVTCTVHLSDMFWFQRLVPALSVDYADDSATKRGGGGLYIARVFSGKRAITLRGYFGYGLLVVDS